MIDRETAFRYLTGALTGGPRPDAVGRKFDAEGRVLRFPGNTTLCHIDRDSDAFAALAEAQARLKAGPLADAFTFLPPESFHMTIFEGVIDSHRTPDRWPRHLPADMPLGEVTRDFSTRLAGLGLDRRFRARPTGILGGFYVDMEGADAAAEAALRLTRDRLQAATNLHRSNHADYGFHITLAYLLRWLAPAEAEVLLDLCDEIGRDLVARVPEIVLGPVEFCRFDDMYRFEPLLHVS
ncbi:DUF1868 domain-containing protein [Salipiger sp. P9]|uniref:DUF1868 domain-containing protein n=1 Tax=Salipiger pentaromativorans TaxID=2943193 RepID=UPI0021570781|nr:DUF1868 domain-containing protein [Salipiger pentaromativorans]MCR8550864.1 DUF1868 domain-containing protein [Salipiger pentaromativorans]